MSYFETCEDCDKVIKSYEYIFCDDCLKNHLKCYVCMKPITKEQDKKSLGNMLCKTCFILERLAYNDRSFVFTFENIRVRLEEKVSQKYKDMTDSELENAWQTSANMIGMLAMKSWNCPKDEESKWRGQAEEYQAIQSIIQNEITQRSKECTK